MKSVIVHAPQGAGKNLHAEKLRKHFRLSHVVEEFEALRVSEIRADGTLYLASIDPTETYFGPAIKALGIHVIAFKDALQQCGEST
jgi:hypothetical protein